MSEKFYALYTESKYILVFDDEEERDAYVNFEYISHPDCISVSFDDIKDMIGDKYPEFDPSFGCYALLAN